MHFESHHLAENMKNLCRDVLFKSHWNQAGDQLQIILISKSLWHVEMFHVRNKYLNVIMCGGVMWTLLWIKLFDKIVSMKIYFFFFCFQVVSGECNDEDFLLIL